MAGQPSRSPPKSIEKIVESQAAWSSRDAKHLEVGTMKEHATPALTLVLADEDVGGRIIVEFEAFLDFDALIREDLDKLEQRWTHLAAPRSTRSGLGPLSR